MGNQSGNIVYFSDVKGQTNELSKMAACKELNSPQGESVVHSTTNLFASGRNAYHNKKELYVITYK